MSETRTLSQIAREIFIAGVELRTAAEQYESKKIGGVDPATRFAKLTAADVEAGLKATLKPAIVKLRTLTSEFVTEAKKVDATIP